MGIRRLEVSPSIELGPLRLEKGTHIECRGARGAITFDRLGMRTVEALGKSVPWSDLVSLRINTPTLPRRIGLLANVVAMVSPVDGGRLPVVQLNAVSRREGELEWDLGPALVSHTVKEANLLDALTEQLSERNSLEILGHADQLGPLLAALQGQGSVFAALANHRVKRSLDAHNHAR
jgi:hypothetical protein